VPPAAGHRQAGCPLRRPLHAVQEHRGLLPGARAAAQGFV